MAKGEVRYRLVLDSKDFVNGIKAARNEAAALGNDMAGRLGKAGSVLSAMGPAGLAAAAGIGAMAAAGGAALKVTVDAVSAAMSYADAMAALEDKTGLSSKALQEFEIAAKLGNTSIDAISTAVSKMQKGIAENSESFKRLGLNLKDLKTMAPEQQFKAVAVAIESINDPAQKTLARYTLLGKGGQEVAGAMKAIASGATELGGALSGPALKAAADLQDQADLLDSAWGRVKLQFGAAVAQSPELRQALQDLTRAAADLATNIAKATPAIVDFFDKLVVNARLALATLKPLATFFKDLATGTGKDAFKHLSDSIEKAALLENMRQGANELGLNVQFGPGHATGGGKPGGFKPPGPKPKKPKQNFLPSGNLSNAASAALLNATPGAFQSDVQKLPMGMLSGDARMSLLSGSSPVLQIQEAKKATIDWRSSLMDVSNAFSTMGGTAGRVLGSVAGGIATIGTMVKSLRTSVDQGGLKGAGGIGGLFGKLGAGLGIAGAAISIGGSIIGGIKSLFGGKSKEEKAAEEAQKQQKIQETIGKLNDLMSKAKQLKMDQLTAGVGGLAGMFAHLAERTDVTADRFRRLEFFGAALFKKLKEEGLSSAEAFKAMGPALDEAIKAATANGQELGGLLGSLAQFREIVTANQGLFDAVKGFNDLVTAVGVTRETIDQIRPEMQALFDEMVGAGATPTQAVGELAQALYEIREAAKEGRIELTDQEKSLIAIGEQSGAFDNLKDPMKELVEVQKAMLELWGAIAHMQGVVLPASLQEYINTLHQIPGDMPGGGSVTHGGGANIFNDFPEQAGEAGHAAGGLHGIAGRGPLAGGGTPFVAHPGEEVYVGAPGGGFTGGGLSLGPIIIQQDGYEVGRAQVQMFRKNKGGITSQVRRHLGGR